jgi:hypothetical protein
MRSHFSLSRGAALACAVSGATSLMTGICSASPFIAEDYATDPAYATWESGDNGGYGFTPWSITGNASTMNSTSPFNQLGMAWTLYKPTPADMVTATRGFAAPLQVNQMISTVFDNPTQVGYWAGFSVGLLSGGTERVSVWRYYVSWWPAGGNPYDLWQVTGPSNDDLTTLHTYDTDGGVRLDIGLTGANTFSLSMTPLDHPELAYSRTGTLANSGDIDAIQFSFFNNATDPLAATDFYISSMTIIPEPSTLGLIGLGGLLFLRRRK